MDYLVICVIPVFLGVYMFSQPDNFYEHTRIRKKGREDIGDPTKFDFIIIRGAGIFFIAAGIIMAVKSLLA